MKQAILMLAWLAAAAGTSVDKALQDLQQSFAVAKQAEEVMKTKALESQSATIAFQQANQVFLAAKAEAEGSCKSSKMELVHKDLVWSCKPAAAK